MMYDFFKKAQDTPHTAVEKGLVYDSPYDPRKSELREIEKAFTRLFLTEDGQKVLAHLQTMTFQRALGPNVADQELRYLEGQRSMIATILRLIDRGRTP